MLLFLQNTSTSAVVSYGTGQVKLNLIHDTANMGGIQIPGQGIGLATALTSDFSDVSCDGLVVSKRPPCCGLRVRLPTLLWVDTVQQSLATRNDRSGLDLHVFCNFNTEYHHTFWCL